MARRAVALNLVACSRLDRLIYLMDRAKWSGHGDDHTSVGDAETWHAVGGWWKIADGGGGGGTTPTATCDAAQYAGTSGRIRWLSLVRTCE